MKTHGSGTFRIRFGPAGSLLFVLFLLFGCGDDEPAPPIPALHVPAEYPHPQAAVDSAQWGDIVLVAPGTYTHSEVRDIDPERFPGGIRASLFMKDGVLVLGEGDLGGVILADTTGSDSTYGAVFDSVSNNAIIENLAFEDYGTGILITGGEGAAGFARISGGRIGIHVSDAVEPILVSNFMEQCDSVGILNQNADALYVVNTVRESEMGMKIRGTGFAWVEANIFCRNRVGLSIQEDATPVLTLNAIVFNSETGMQLGTGAVPYASATPRWANVGFNTGSDLYENPVNLEVIGYDPPLEDTLDVAKQHWGTVDFDEIESGILDSRDDPARGAIVDYLPIPPDSNFFLVFLESALDVCDLQSPQEAGYILSILGEMRGSRRIPAPRGTP